MLVGTGQTGLMQGAKYGVAMDAVPPQFCCGELEGAIVAASDLEQPDVILIEAFADTKVIGLTLNHEGMSKTEVADMIREQSQVLGLPVTDALGRPVAQLLAMVLAAYPGLQQGTPVAAI